MKFTIDLLPRYQAAFGYVATKLDIASRVGIQTGVQHAENLLLNKFKQGVATASVKSRKAQAAFNSDAQFFINSSFCFADMALKHPELSIRFGDFNKGATYRGDGAFIAPPMIGISRDKAITTTQPDRGEGEVVENFSKKSYEIALKGLIVDLNNHQYPSAQVKQLRKFFDINDIFEVESCKLFEDLGIYGIYLTSWGDLSGVEGFEDTLSYSFTARSIQPVQFEVY